VIASLFVIIWKREKDDSQSMTRIGIKKLPIRPRNARKVRNFPTEFS
jgi:hypothetical protein